MNGNVSPLHLGMLYQELNQTCGMPMNRASSQFIGPAIQHENLVTSVNAMNDYAGTCMSRMIDAQLGVLTTPFGELSIDMSAVPFDGNRLELIYAFRIVATGEAVPDHSLAQIPDYNAYKNFIAPAFTD